MTWKVYYHLTHSAFVARTENDLLQGTLGKGSSTLLYGLDVAPQVVSSGLVTLPRVSYEEWQWRNGALFPAPLVGPRTKPLQLTVADDAGLGSTIEGAGQ